MPLSVAFLHPDLGIGGAERLVVDAALGLQNLGHSVDLYTSHHDANHCFEETRNGNLSVHHIQSPFPNAWRGKFHILFAHARQLHLTQYLLRSSSPRYDVYFVDQLSTCIPFLRAIANRRVVFYCHFPDKLLADGEYVEGRSTRQNAGFLKRLYRWPMDWIEEATTRQADIILANSKFTARVLKSHLPSVHRTPRIIYPGINVAAYEITADLSDEAVLQVASYDRVTFLSLNRFEKKKNAKLAIDAFAALKERRPDDLIIKRARLVLAGGYDPRLEDNMMTLVGLIDTAKQHSLTYNILAPSSSPTKIPPFDTTPDLPDVLFLLNFTTAQRSALLTAPTTLVFMYTPANEHFGIGPVEAMLSGLPVLACDSGGPTESVVNGPADERTGWLRPPSPNMWADALEEIMALSVQERDALRVRAQTRAKELFSMVAMAKGIESALEEAVRLGPVSALNTRMFLVASVACLFAIFAFYYL